MDEETRKRIEALEMENQILRVKVAKNEGDCEQQWMILRTYFAEKRAKLDTKTWATLITSLVFSGANLFFKFIF